MKKRAQSSSLVSTKSQPDDSLMDQTNGSETPSNPKSENLSKTPDPLTTSGVFEEFHRIGSELKHNIKTFEENNVYLSNQSIKLQQDVDLLKKKRDFQKTVWVDLQMNAEKLDQMKQLVEREYSLDRDRHFEHLNQQFKQVCDNDKYLIETHNNIKRILIGDKQNVADLANQVHKEREDQTKSIGNYKTEIESLYASYIHKIQTAAESENKINDELELTITEYKNHEAAQEKFEFELHEKYSNLTVIENEVAQLTTKVDKCKEQLNAVLDKNAIMSQELKNNEELHKTEVQQNKAQNEELNKNVKSKMLELNESEEKLNKAMEKHSFLLNKTKNLESDLESSNEEVVTLIQQNDDLRQQITRKTSELKQLENSLFDLQKCNSTQENEIAINRNILATIFETKSDKVHNLETQLVSLEKKRAEIETKYDSIKRTNGEHKRRNDAAKLELQGVLDNLERIESEFELETKLSELEDLRVKRGAFDEQIVLAESEMKSVEKEIEELKRRNAALNLDFEDVCYREGRSEFFQEKRRRLEEINAQISTARKEVELIKDGTAIHPQLLRQEMKKLEREIDEETKAFDKNQQILKAAHQKTLQNVNGLRENMKKNFEDEKRRKPIEIHNLQTSLRHIQQGVAECKNNLITITDRNIKSMKDRLKSTRQLIEGYKQLLDRAQTSQGSGFTTLRLLETIEEHLKPSMQGMMEYLAMSPVGPTTPSYALYSRTLNDFERRFQKMISAKNARALEPTHLEELKNLAFCLFGLRRYSETIAGTTDSPFFSPSSSNQGN